jgi:ubiquinol-cytochrome c reductase cytochrome c subunit
MAKNPRARTKKTGRRHPLATVALIAIGLLTTGGAYAAFSSAATAEESTVVSQSTIDEGEQLFKANCATCHGMDLEGGEAGPSLIGVGAAAVDFQVGTGRMPLAQDAPQAEDKPRVFNDEQTLQMAAYVASIAPGPGIPNSEQLALTGDATKGAELFRINCAMCHNVAGAGGALTEGKYAPNLMETSPAHIYEAMLTGPQNMPVFNDNNITPEEKQDIITALKTQNQSASVGGFELGSLGPVAEGLFLWIFGLGAVVAFTVWLTAKAN